MTAFAERLALVQSRIEAAARACGRHPSSVRLLAVSKLHPPESIRAAYAAGLRAFGENYAQELAQKAEALSDLPDITWHMIGHLQTNKARLVAPVAGTVHTIDSSKLAAELGKRAALLGRTIDVLVEVSLSGEETKTGCQPADLPAILDAVRAESALRLRGLMTMPPYTDDPEEARPFFARLRALRDQHGHGADLPDLSMGMSHDLEAAIAEGATLVRVGTALFGDRSTATTQPVR